MISHIYLALGRWDEVERANVVADQVVDAQRAADGQQPTSCGHCNEWLAYSLDQQGKDSGTLVESCNAPQAIAASGKGEDSSVLGWPETHSTIGANIAVRHGVDTGQWTACRLGPGRQIRFCSDFTFAYGRLLAAPKRCGDCSGCTRSNEGLSQGAYSRQLP